MINTKIVITLVLVGLFSLCKAYIACFDVFEGHRGFGNSTVLRLRTILEDLSLTLNMAKSGALANSSCMMRCIRRTTKNNILVRSVFFVHAPPPTHPSRLANACLLLYREGINSSFLTRLNLWRCVAKVFCFEI